MAAQTSSSIIRIALRVAPRIPLFRTSSCDGENVMLARIPFFRASSYDGEKVMLARRTSTCEEPSRNNQDSSMHGKGNHKSLDYMGNSSIIFFSESRHRTTSSRASSRYLAIWSLPPPGLYSPNDEVYASSFTLFRCESHPSTASIHSSNRSGSTLFCAFVSSLSIWKRGDEVLRSPRYTRTRSGSIAPLVGLVVSWTQLSSKNWTSPSPFCSLERSPTSCAAAAARGNEATAAEKMA
mmetsp:Transcript_23446/g.58233  ORF Transcript_23446/g.58233 Transcript_23446/m.58233 type:complete len:238 (+) Transcript_23446:83-796(+)